MAKRLRVTLDEKQRRELERVCDKHALPYMREKAAAILKIAAGRSGRDVALNGLLRPRDPDAVYGWVRRYLAEGVDGLLVKSGRGRKPAFSPSTQERRKRPG